MHLPRLYVDNALETGDTFCLPETAAHHVSRVLRLSVGADLVLFNGRGGEYLAKVRTCAKIGVEVEVLDHVPVDRESPLRIILAQGISKGDRMDYTIQKAVELGVHRLVPLRTNRTVVSLDGERAAKRLAHWQGVVISACEQSGRTRIPEFEPISRLDDWWGICPVGLRLVFALDGQTNLTALPAPLAGVCLLMGPEGGLDATEIAAAQRAGFLAVRLGPRVLRTETAPLAAIAALQALWGDLR